MMRPTLRAIALASAGILTCRRFEERRELIECSPEYAPRLTAPDPFNRPGDDTDLAALRSNPPAWRALDGGRAGIRGPLTPDEIRDRQNRAGIARHYRADGVANRLERELAEDIRRYGRTWATRTGYPLSPVGGGSAA
jgi:hypothetical protein